MKTLTRFVFMLILVFVTINTLAQNGLEGKKSIYLQFGASGGYSPNLSQPVLIPQLGFDATLGLIGFRANGQFFKNSPEFDINDYLDPIKSVLTISNLQETNSNILLGINPYINIGRKAFSIQPGIGIKYLMQKGATATAVYNQTPGTSILKFPDGEANRNIFMIEPNIRASFGLPGQMFRFFIEAGYTFPVGKNEISYSSRSLTGVVDPSGNIDVKALLDSKTIITTEKSLPAFASVSAGLQIKLFSGKDAKISRSNMPNNYGINDEGIKRTIQIAEEPKKGVSIKNNIENETKLFLYSYSWVRNCPEPPGGQEYFSYVEDRNFTYIKYEGCSGGYNEWFYSAARQNDTPIILVTDGFITDSFLKMVETIKRNRNIPNIYIEQMENSQHNAFNEFINDIERNKTKGGFIKSKLNKMTGFEIRRNNRDDWNQIIEEGTENNIAAYGCRHYTQSYTIKRGNCLEEYTAYTWVCPEGTSQIIVNWGCPETQVNSIGRFSNMVENNSPIIYPVMINGKRIDSENIIKDDAIKNFASILSKFEFAQFNTLPLTKTDKYLCEVVTDVKSYFGDKLIKYNSDFEYSDHLISKSEISKIEKLNFNELQNYLLSIYNSTSFNSYGINDEGIKRTISPSVNNYGINDEGIKRTIAPSVNNYGINDEGIKRTTLQTFTSVNSYGINDNQLMRTGEPVPGAEVYIELESDEDPIINVTTNENGEFNFETADVPNFPQSGTFNITVVPSKAFAISKNIPIKKQKIKVRFKTPKDGKFQFILFWEQQDVKAENKGSFAVSGKNST